MAHKIDVFNLGLPRTGTTSTVEAFAKMGFKCVPIGARYFAHKGQNPPWKLRPEPLLVQTVRPFEDWAASAIAHPVVPVSCLEAAAELWERHQEWLALLLSNDPRPCADFDVSQGDWAFWSAMAQADYRPYPHLNAR